MNYNRLLPVILVLFFLIPGFLFSQDTVSVISSQLYQVKWNSDPGSSDKNSCLLIRDIAYDAVLDINQTCINIKFDVACKVSQQDNDYSSVHIYAGTPLISGNTIIRGFDISKVLKPELLSLSIIHKRKSDSLVLEIIEVENVKWNNPEKPVFTASVKKINLKSDTLIFRINRLSYVNDDFNRFRNHIRTINDYYACSGILDSLKVLALSENLVSMKNLPLNFIRIQEFSKAVTVIEEKDFVRNLDLNKFDPKNFQLKYKELFRLSKTMVMTFKEKLDTVSSINISNPPDAAVNAFIDHFLRYIRWSQLVNSRNGHVYDDYLSNYFNMQLFDDDRKIMKKILMKMNLTENPDSLYSSYCNIVCKAFERKAIELMANFQFAEANRLIEAEEKFINYTGVRPSDEKYQMLKIQSANGIYNSYLGVAETSLRHGKLRMAEIYLSKAQEYRSGKPAAVTNDSIFEIVSSEIIAIKLSECDTLSAHENSDDAINCYMSINLSYDSLTTNVLKREINRKTDFCYFNKYRKAGYYYLETSNLPDAGKFLHKACDLQIKNSFPADSILDSLCYATYPYYLVSLLRGNEDLIWTDKLMTATFFADSVNLLAKSSGALQNQEVVSAMNRYLQKIKDKGCYNATGTFEIFILRAQKNFEMKNFLKGNILTDSALHVSRNHPNCSIDTTMAVSGLKTYLAPSRFQRQMFLVSNMISVNDYEKAVDSFIENENFYYENQIQTFGVTCPALYDYVKTRSLCLLTLECVNHHIKNSGYKDALTFLKLLRLQDYPSRDVVALQKELGKNLALVDFRKDTEVTVLLENYLTSDKWFSPFRSAYISQWNTLKKEKQGKVKEEMRN